MNADKLSRNLKTRFESGRYEGDWGATGMFEAKSLSRIICKVVVAAGISVAMAPAFGAAVQIDDPAMLRDLHVPTYVWQQEGDSKPQAIVVGFHGGCLHGKSFDTLGRKLADRDVMFVSLDMRGYGKWYYKNYGTEDDKTFNYTRTIEDIRGVLTALHKQYPGTPVYCIGESLGANMAMVIGHKMPELTNGVVLVSPVYGPRIWLSPRFLANGAHVALHPRKGMLDMSPYLKTRLSPNPELSLQQIEDPLSRDKQTAKELGQSMALNFSGKKQSRMINAPTAVLIMHGKEDRLCNPRVTAREFEKIPTSNKQLALLDGVGHLAVETSEIDPKVFSTLTTWIDAQGKAIATR